MNRVVEFPDYNVIEQEAAAWVAKLDGGTLSRAELKALRQWAQQSPKHRSTLEEMAARWDLLDVLKLTQQATNSTTRPANPIGRRWAVGAALAAGLAAIMLTIGVWRTDSGGLPEVVESPNTTYFTAIGEQQTVVLPDQSVVRINTNSRLQVDYSAEQRRIFLQQGEAFFDVAKDSIPFVVMAGKGQVMALGTAFAVRLSDENIVQVDITEGSVMVSVTSETTSLNPSQQTVPSRVFSSGEVARIGDSIELVQSLEPAILERQLSWREGMLVFDGDSLESVIAEFSRYTTVEIVIADPSLRQKKIIGYFPTTNTELLLDTLASNFGIDVDKIRPDLVYLRSITPL